MAYVSNVLTHWVGRGKPPDEQYQILTECILKKKELLYSPCQWHFHSKYGGIRKGTYSIHMISFTDIPFSECTHHCEKYSHFGLSLEKTYMATCLAGPVGYVQNPFVHSSYSGIYHSIWGVRSLIDGKPIPAGERKDKVFSTDEVLSWLHDIAFFLEDYSDKEFKYHEVSDQPLPGQETFFDDPSALYYEREWRMVLRQTAKKLPWQVSRDSRTYFRFDERFLRWVILPREYVARIQQERQAVFGDYQNGQIPSIIAYEDLRYF